MVNKNLPAVPGLVDAPAVLQQAGQPMSIEQFDQRMGLIKHVVGQMQDRIHYGVIPGTSDKSLWEPGAEYLRAAFNIAWDYDMEEAVEDYDKGEFRYRVTAFAIAPNGMRFARWTASASAKERKFWCWSTCPKDCAQEHRPMMEAGMLPHNVRDRAIKRAFVAMIRNVTGTTGYFKQALDSGDEGGQPQRGRPQAQRQQAQASAPAQPATPPKAEDDNTRFFREAKEMGYTPEGALKMLETKTIAEWIAKTGKDVDAALAELSQYKAGA